MKYIKSYKIFEAKNSPEVVAYLKEILETLRLDGFKVNVGINEPSLFLRGFARVVGAGSLPDINVVIEKTEGVRYDELGPYIEHVFSYLTEQNYSLRSFGVWLKKQHRNEFPVNIIFIKDGAISREIPNCTNTNLSWTYDYFESDELSNRLVKEVSLSFKKK